MRLYVCGARVPKELETMDRARLKGSKVKLSAASAWECTLHTKHVGRHVLGHGTSWYSFEVKTNRGGRPFLATKQTEG